MLGRSTGTGALSVWMHNLDSINVIEEISTDNYTGPAVEIGAGVTGAALAKSLDGTNLAVVSGECPSVGAAGGFLQGGGHSTLSTSFGLGADQTLIFEVVTAGGDIVKASPTQNTDLYWALDSKETQYELHCDVNWGNHSLEIWAQVLGILWFYSAIP